ncbi:MAG TPA: DNA polymerase III subunit gamma/tau [Dehalococcoidia bacterium]|nr:DNA polymerase III subunit gamma/tau [Dehalococcoidia bacterium]
MPEILYRKWRPRSFSELAGQDHVATTLRNALRSGKAAHAYLFAGPRGTGKTTTGRVLAKALNCTDLQDGEPCNQCESCQSYNAGRAMDLIEMDAASNRGIEEIRNLRDKVAFSPGAGEKKVYLIDEVHMLTEAAFNALLKTLEEPPPHVVFILATTETHKVPATIVSRCQRFDFRRISLAATVRRLEQICEGEGIACEQAALEMIARQATGSLRDAVNLLDQLTTSYGRELTVDLVRAGLGLIDDPRAAELARAAIRGDLGHGLEVIASVRDDGLDLRQFQREVVRELRGLLLVKEGLPPADGATPEQLEEMRAAVADVPVAVLLAALKAFGEADLKPDPNSTLPLDIALSECILSRGARNDGGAVAQSGPAPVADSMRDASPPASGRPRPPAAPTPRPQPAHSREAGDARREPAPASAVPATNGADGTPLEAARQRMQQIYYAAKARDTRIGAFVNSACDIIEADDQMITLGFLHLPILKMVQEPQNLQVLAEVASEVLGRSVKVRCVHDPGVEPWNRRFSRSPLVRAAEQMGARVVPRSEE